MMIKNKKQTGKTVVEQLREIRDRLSLEIKDMTPEQLKDFLKKQKSLRAGMTEDHQKFNA